MNEFTCDGCWNICHIAEQHEAEYLDLAGNSHSLYLCSTCLRQQERERQQELEQEAFERNRGIWD